MHVSDDRGNRVPLLPQLRFSIIPGVRSPIPIEHRRLMIRKNRRITFKKRTPLPMQLLGGVVYLVWWLVWWQVFSVLFNRWNAPDTLNYAVMPTLFLGSLPILYWIYRQSICEATPRIIADHGYCATCGYALADIPAADDGCTVCPECGSAWRIGPPGV